MSWSVLIRKSRRVHFDNDQGIESEHRKILQACFDYKDTVNSISDFRVNANAYLITFCVSKLHISTYVNTYICAYLIYRCCIICVGIWGLYWKIKVVLEDIEWKLQSTIDELNVHTYRVSNCTVRCCTICSHIHIMLTDIIIIRTGYWTNH